MNKTSSSVSVEIALDYLRQGKMIILQDDTDRENEGDLVIAAECVTPEAINFMTHYGRGLVCLAMMAADFDRLAIPMMVNRNRSRQGTAFGVSIGAADGITTGISAQDRAHTVRVATAVTSTGDDIVMPGHVFPLRARQGGVLRRRGHTEGSVDLARLAGLRSAAVLCEIMNDDGSMARLPELTTFAQCHQLPMISIQDVVNYRLRHEDLLQKVSSAHLPIDGLGKFYVHSFRHKISNVESIALVSSVSGKMDNHEAPLVRIHSQCLTGDVFGSGRCDCGAQLSQALARIAHEGGVLLYLCQEGRGIGLANKIKAYALQDQGFDTVEANHQLGFAADERDYSIAAQMLRALHISRIRLMTNNPQKLSQLSQYGIEVVERIAIQTKVTADNKQYLATKQQKLGHWLDLLEQ